MVICAAPSAKAPGAERLHQQPRLGDPGIQLRQHLDDAVPLQPGSSGLLHGPHPSAEGSRHALPAHSFSAALSAKSATFLSCGSLVYWWKRHLALMRGLPAVT